MYIFFSYNKNCKSHLKTLGLGIRSIDDKCIEYNNKGFIKYNTILLKDENCYKRSF